MKVLLNAYSGQNVVAPGLLDFLRWMELDGVRRVLVADTPPEQQRTILRQANRHPDLFWSFAFAGWTPSPAQVELFESYLKVPAQFEVGVEATLEGLDPQDYAASFEPLIAKSPVPLIINTTHRLRRKEYDWLVKFERQLHPKAEISVHTYRDHVWVPDTGFGSVVEMFESLRSVLSRRVWHNTETGWHSAKKPICKALPCLKWFMKCGRSELEIAEFLQAEIHLHKAYGAKTFTIYQAYTGPTEKPFGLLQEGTLEPLERAKILRRLLR